MTIMTILENLFGFLTVYADGGEAAAGPMGAGQYSSIIMIVLMLAVFYFILIRPQKKREKELKNMIAGIKMGDEVVTIGGIHGKITRIKDETFILETGVGSSKSFIQVDRSSVSRLVKQADDHAKVTPIPDLDEAEDSKEDA